VTLFILRRRRGRFAPTAILESGAFSSRDRPSIGICTMNVEKEVLNVLDEVLSLGGRGHAFTRATHLLGAVPELDSMAVVTLITTLEERLGITVDDGDIDGSVFATVGSLVDFVAAQLAA